MNINIINANVVGSAADLLWNDRSDIIKNAVPKPVLVLVSKCEPGSVEDTQLQKMLAACKLEPEHYNLLRLPDDEVIAWHQLRERLDPKIIFLLGVLPARLGISALFRINEANNFSDRTWLPTLSIGELEQHADIKKQLWVNGMKPLFVDNTAWKG